MIDIWLSIPASQGMKLLLVCEWTLCYQRKTCFLGFLGWHSMHACSKYWLTHTSHTSCFPSLHGRIWNYFLPYHHPLTLKFLFLPWLHWLQLLRRKGVCFLFMSSVVPGMCVIVRKATLLSITSKRILVRIDVWLPTGAGAALSNACCREDCFSQYLFSLCSLDRILKAHGSL